MSNRRFSWQFRVQLCSDIRSGVITRLGAQRKHRLSGQLMTLWLGQFDRGELSQRWPSPPWRTSASSRSLRYSARWASSPCKSTCLKNTTVRTRASYDPSLIITGPPAARSRGMRHDRPGAKHLLLPLTRGRSDASDAQLLERIDAIQRESPSYGVRRVHAELRRQGVTVNHKRVWRVMHEFGRMAARSRRFLRCPPTATIVYPNLYRNRIPQALDQVWVADLTYIRLHYGFCYLAAILDACSRKAIGYALSRSVDAQLTLAALRAAIQRRRPPPGCIHHSDQGVQYACAEYRNACRRTACVAR